MRGVRRSRDAGMGRNGRAKRVGVHGYLRDHFLQCQMRRFEPAEDRDVLRVLQSSHREHGLPRSGDGGVAHAEQHHRTKSRPPFHRGGRACGQGPRREQSEQTGDPDAEPVRQLRRASERAGCHQPHRRPPIGAIAHHRPQAQCSAEQSSGIVRDRRMHVDDLRGRVDVHRATQIRHGVLDRRHLVGHR